MATMTLRVAMVSFKVADFKEVDHKGFVDLWLGFLLMAERNLTHEDCHIHHLNLVRPLKEASWWAFQCHKERC
jgi:hypothetical protein